TKTAPNDEAVQRLAVSLAEMGRRSQAPLSGSDAAISLSDGEIEELSEDDIDDPELIPSEAPTAQVQVIAPRVSNVPSNVPIDLRHSARAPMVSGAPELEVLDEGSFGAGEDPEAAFEAQRVMADAESFYKLGLYPKAIQ